MNTTQPEALQLAECCEHGYPLSDEAIRAAAELRRLHAYCQELESQVILDCMTHVQNPAGIEHVAGDVSKNGAGLNMSTQHTRITELESQLAQRFDAADMATASAQGFRDGVASVSAWSEHVEQRLLAWRQSFVNRSGDQLALDDFMDKQSIDDLIDFVCDESHRVTHWMPLPTAPGPADGESNG